MKKLILLLVIIAFLVTNSNSQTVTDYDGNIYNTVTIGTQVWLRENLKVTHYRNGDTIPNEKVAVFWDTLSTGAYCNYYNNSLYGVTFGKLYNWYTVKDNRKLCPKDWHVPSDTEWTTLKNYLSFNNFNYDGTKYGNRYAKSLASTNRWATSTEIGSIGNTDYPNNRNITGFTSLPSGYREKKGSFKGIGLFCFFWSSTEDNIDTLVLFQGLDYSSFAVSLFSGVKWAGFSVRCLRDTPAQINTIDDQEKINIYPNPANDYVNIKCSNRQNLKMQLFNTIGECVLHKELNNLTNSIDISSLTKGIYIMKIISPNGTIEMKIIKE